MNTFFDQDNLFINTMLKYFWYSLTVFLLFLACFASAEDLNTTDVFTSGEISTEDETSTTQETPLSTTAIPLSTTATPLSTTETPTTTVPLPTTTAYPQFEAVLFGKIGASVSDLEGAVVAYQGKLAYTTKNADKSLNGHGFFVTNNQRQTFVVAANEGKISVIKGAASVTPAPPPSPQEEKSDAGVVIGCIFGLLGLVAIVIALLVVPKSGYQKTGSRSERENLV